MTNRSRQKTNMIFGIGLIVIVGLISVGMIWYGLSDRFSTDEPAVSEAPPTVVAIASSNPEPTGLPVPQVIVDGDAPSAETEPVVDEQATESEPQAEATANEVVEQPETAQEQPTETPLPPEETSTTPMVTAGGEGVYIRSGAGTNFAQISALAPNQQAPITGYYGDWWQIQFNGRTGWVYGGVVSAANTGSVPQVQPPAAPTATPVPPTAVPAPTTVPQPSNSHGLIVNSFVIEGAPGPFGKNEQIWYSWNITNTGGEISYRGLGVYIKQRDEFRNAWTSKKRVPEYHRTNFKVSEKGTFKIFLRLCITDDDCENLAGPILVDID